MRPSPGHPSLCRRELLATLALAVTLLSAPGCAVLAPDPPRSGGDGLSQAAKAAEENPDKKKKR